MVGEKYGFPREKLPWDLHYMGAFATILRIRRSLKRKTLSLVVGLLPVAAYKG